MVFLKTIFSIIISSIFCGMTLYAAPSGDAITALPAPNQPYVIVESIAVDDEWTLVFGTRTATTRAWEAPVAELRRNADGSTVALPAGYVWLRYGNAFATVVDGVIYAQARHYGETGIYQILPGLDPEITRISRPGDNTFWWQAEHDRNSGPIFVVGTDHVVAYVAFASQNAETDLAAGITDVTVLVPADPANRTDPGQQALRHHVAAEERLPIWTAPDGNVYLLRPRNGTIQRAAVVPADVAKPTGNAVAPSPAGITLELYATVDTANGNLDWRTSRVCTFGNRVIAFDANRIVTELYRPAETDMPPLLRSVTIPGHGMVREITRTPDNMISFTLGGTRQIFDPVSFVIRD